MWVLVILMPVLGFPTEVTAKFEKLETCVEFVETVSEEWPIVKDCTFERTVIDHEE